MNFIGGAITLIVSLSVLFGSRRVAALGVFAGVCYVTQGQVLDVLGFHFYAIRIVLLVGFIRILARGELQRIELTAIDRILIAYVVLSETIEAYRLGVWQEQVGAAYNILLAYFVFRSLVADWNEFQDLLPGLAILIIPVAVSMAFESLTGNNVYNVMGGQLQAKERGERFRCIGCFRGPHTAGAFGATLMPLFVGMLFGTRRNRAALVTGLIAATAITYTSNSSGPLMGYLSCLVGLACWRLRGHMKRMRQGIVVGLIGYALFSKAPIWYIFSKVADITGGDGWYRSHLMDMCFRHFFDWWLLGTSDTSQWAVTLMSWGGADLCNMYVACAASAGLTGLTLFILLLTKCFSNLGLALQLVRDSRPQEEWLLWGLGSALFGHVVIFFSVTYWDQMDVVWWSCLAFIASVTSGILKKQPLMAEATLVSEPVELEGAV